MSTERRPARRHWIESERPAETFNRRSRRLERLIEGRAWLIMRFCSDSVMLVISAIAAVAAGCVSHAALVILVYPPTAVLLLHARGRYSQRLRDVVLDNLAPGFGAISIAAMSIFVLDALLHGGSPEAGVLMMRAWGFSLLSVSTAGILLTALQHQARKRGLVGRPTLIVGSDRVGLNIAERLRAHPEYGLRPFGFLENAEGTRDVAEPSICGTLADLPLIARSREIGHVIVGFPNASDTELLELIRTCDEFGIETTVVPRLSNAINHQTQFEYLGALPLLNLRAIDPTSWQFALKHVIDREIAAVLLILLSPLLALIAIAVRMTSAGPILFGQVRAGRDDNVFRLWKFRTMADLPTDSADFRPATGLAPGGVEGVDRRTAVGKLLRRASLDELPQLFNVLRGDMSLVGPRPERPEFVERFDTEVARYGERHRVRAGITGWAQVHGLRGQTSLADRIELDNFYIEHWSLSLDLKILLLTIPAAIRGER